MRDYIPKSTTDVAAVERLKRLPLETVRKDVPILLEWMQDTHWDVAREIAQYLLPYINEITDELLFVLNSDDSMWKSYLINILIARSKTKLDPILIDALRKLAEHPSLIEIEDGTDETAKRVLENSDLCS